MARVFAGALRHLLGPWHSPWELEVFTMAKAFAKFFAMALRPLPGP